ncbi:MAG: GMP synthase-like glutamine amidotransferase [Lentimonas sp.]|jgi:GMP synthase-like glutamine amidotransferase
MKILCLKHIAFEGPGTFALWAQARGHELTIESVYQNKPLPSPDTFDALLVMGGPMNIYEDAIYPWLTKEKSYIRSAIAAGKHVIGVCLGAQLIAHALGAKVTAGSQKEIGWFPIQPSPDCPAALPLPDQLRVLHWHGDTFDIPQGAQSIAHSAACAHQGFLYRDRVLALQCHLEITPQSLALLIAACSNELVEAPYIQEATIMQAEPEATYEQMQAVLFEMLDALVVQ